MSAANYGKPVVHNHITLKPHHKKIIIGGSSLVFILLITLSVFTYMIFVRQQLNYNLLDKKVSDLKLETQSNVNTLSESLIQTKSEIINLSSGLGVINQEFRVLKASAGEDFSGIIEQSVPSVVTIKTDVSQGTGFLIDSEGYIVTNYHVVEGAQAANVITSDTTNHAVGLVGYDSDLDIALLKIDGTYDAFSFANSDSITVGEKVIAIGNPLGLQFSVSQGIVSAVHRTGPNGVTAYIQTDAALNPGNSGGPLIDKNGEVIGINNFKASDSESLGFALEANYIKETVNNIFQQKYGEDLL